MLNLIYFCVFIFPQLEAENAEFKDAIRKLKFEVSNSNTTVVSLESSKKALEMSVSNAKDRADRESLSTVLAQQRLISVLQNNLRDCSEQAESMYGELCALRKTHQETLHEVTKWKAIAMNGSPSNTALVSAELHMLDAEQQQTVSDHDNTHVLAHIPEKNDDGGEEYSNTDDVTTSPSSRNKNILNHDDFTKHTADELLMGSWSDYPQPSEPMNQQLQQGKTQPQSTNSAVIGSKERKDLQEAQREAEQELQK